MGLSWDARSCIRHICLPRAPPGNGATLTGLGRRDGGQRRDWRTRATSVLLGRQHLPDAVDHRAVDPLDGRDDPLAQVGLLGCPAYQRVDLDLNLLDGLDRQFAAKVLEATGG